MADDSLSIVITAFNEERYLEEAISSVLSQAGDDVEVVVVDDGSTDATAEIAARHQRIKVISQPNQGHGAALNTGIANTSGSLLAFLDGDDFWEPGTLSRRRERFRDPTLEMTQGMVIEFVSPELADSGTQFERVDGNPVPGPLAGSTMVRRTALTRVGAFDTELELGAFLDWMARSREANLATRMVDEVVLHRRIHDQNVTQRMAHRKTDYVHLLKRALDRRRGSE